MIKILVLTSTFPKKIDDNLPMFVYDQLSSIQTKYPNLSFKVLVPHYYDLNIVDGSLKIEQIRFHYFWPNKWEKLVGNGILPTLKKNWLYILLIPFFLVSQFVSTFVIIKREKPKLIYAHWFFPQAFISFLISKILKIQYVFTTHALDASILNKLPFFGKYISRKIILSSSAYTADSVNAENKLHSCLKDNEIKKQKSLVLPMPINFESKITPSKKIIELYKKLEKSDSKTLLYIGRFASKKGVENLINILYFLNLEKVKCNLILAGSGPEYQRYQNLINSLNLNNFVRFVGFVNKSEKKILFDLSDICVVPSVVTKFGDSEGLPVVVLESLASNVITLASFDSNAAEVIKHKFNGFLFDSSNFKESSKLILDIFKLSKEETNNLIKQANYSVEKYKAENSADVFYNHLFKNFI